MNASNLPVLYTVSVVITIVFFLTVNGAFFSQFVLSGLPTYFLSQTII